MKTKMNKKEQEYKELMDKQHIPCELCKENFEIFNKLLKTIQIYQPDFYLPNTKTYIEIIGSRQAYSYNENKYENFRKQYPELDFKILTPNGIPYHTNKKLDIKAYKFTKEEIRKAKDVLINKPEEIQTIMDNLEIEYSKAEIAVKLGKCSQYVYLLHRGKIKPKLISLLILLRLLNDKP